MFSLLKKRIDILKIRRFYERYERFLIPGALLFGITTDVILFRTVNLNLAFSILTFHFILSGLIIAFMHLHNFGFLRFKGTGILRILSPLFLQYTFGALLSGFLIFYWFSSSFIASWPFIVLIVILMISNDLLKKYYLWFRVQIGVYFFITFSLSVLIFPFVVKGTGAVVFLLGGFLSLVIITSYLYGLSLFLPRVYRERKSLTGIIVIIFLTMNVFYFSNVIPPVPLTLRDSEVAHSVERVDGEYVLKLEKSSFWQRLMGDKRIHITEGSRVYFFSSVLAPVWLGTDVVHHWQYYDPMGGRWVSKSEVRFPIVGGRDEGYRGYSFSDGVFPGRWRVLVETPRGQVIGKDSFYVESVDMAPDMTVEVK